MCTGAVGENTQPHGNRDAQTHTYTIAKSAALREGDMGHRDRIPYSAWCWGHISQFWWSLLLPIRIEQNPLIRSCIVTSIKLQRWIILIRPDEQTYFPTGAFCHVVMYGTSPLTSSLPSLTSPIIRTESA